LLLQHHFPIENLIFGVSQPENLENPPSSPWDDFLHFSHRDATNLLCHETIVIYHQFCKKTPWRNHLDPHLFVIFDDEDHHFPAGFP
jgi:hypothetical protein